MHTDRLAPFPAPRSRRGALAALVALVPTTATGASARRRKKRNPCDERNWCVDRTHTCGPDGKHGKCLIGIFGSNVCAEILFQTKDCADCEAPNCVDCACTLAAGGGDRCNNGANGYDYICARPL